MFLNCRPQSATESKNVTFHLTGTSQPEHFHIDIDNLLPATKYYLSVGVFFHNRFYSAQHTLSFTTIEGGKLKKKKKVVGNKWINKNSIRIILFLFRFMLVLRPECSVRTRLIPWLMMTWWLALPGHQQTWCELIEAEWRIYASVNYTIISSDNGFLPVWRQPIIWIIDGLLSIGP